MTTPNDEAVAILCEVAFARMIANDYHWCRGNRSGPDTKRGIDDLRDIICDCEARFYSGERTLSLLREMERVTEELRGEK